MHRSFIIPFPGISLRLDRRRTAGTWLLHPAVVSTLDHTLCPAELLRLFSLRLLAKRSCRSCRRMPCGSGLWRAGADHAGQSDRQLVPFQQDDAFRYRLVRRICHRSAVENPSGKAYLSRPARSGRADAAWCDLLFGAPAAVPVAKRSAALSGFLPQALLLPPPQHLQALLLHLDRQLRPELRVFPRHLIPRCAAADLRIFRF